MVPSLVLKEREPLEHSAPISSHNPTLSLFLLMDPLFAQFWIRLLLALSLLSSLSGGSPVNSTIADATEGGSDDHVIVTLPDRSVALEERSNCFPGFNFRKPQEPPSSLGGWWCDWNSEYAFVGFSYEVSECESLLVSPCSLPKAVS